MKVFWAVILVIESVLIITGNIMAIIVFLKKNFAVARSSYMLVNLTIADVLVGVAVFLTFLELTFSSQYMFSACIGETVNRVAQSVSLFAMFASLVSMALTALERMMAILFPFRLRNAKDLHYAVAIAISWCLSVPFVFLRLINVCSDTKARKVTNRLLLILQAVAIITIILSYAAIFVKVRFFPEFQSSSSMKKNIRLAKTLMMTAAIAILTWMPRFAGKIFKEVSSSLQDIDVYLTLLHVGGDHETRDQGTLPEVKGFAVLPYVQNVTERISRVLSQHNIRVASKPVNTIRRMISRPKDKLEDSKKTGVVYKIPCADLSYSLYWAFAKNVGCPEDLSKLRDCLEPKDAMAIINASLAVPWPNFVPVIDDHFLDDDPKILYQKQDFEKYDIMIGVTNDEGTVFTNAVAGLGEGLNVTNGVSREVFVGVIRGGGLSTVIPDPKSVLINASIHEYTDYTQVSSPITNRRMYMDMMGDVGFVAPAIRGANAYAKKKAVTYFYSFDHRHGDAVMGSKVPSWVRAYHGADISFVFGAPLLDPATTPTDANFTRDILKMWTNFAKTGDPNKPDSLGVTWPVYTLEEQKYMSLKPNMAVHSHLRANYIAFWNEFVPNALHAARRPKQHPCGRGEDRKATAALVLMLSLLTTWF
ncbi:Acetylcholinesterase [Exaiptasia diaphana]|nr:Acetylcholinesterase [Exaiptasia diaphana]